MNPYVELIRPNICFLAISGFIVGLLIAKLPPNLWIFPILAVFLITASGNVINDYFDFKIDKINKPRRPLPSGKIPRKEALVLYFVLGSVGLMISFLVSLNFFILALFNSILVFLYSWRFKKTWLGNSVVSFLACSVFVAPVFILYGIKELLASPVITLTIIAFFGNYGREVLKDVEDVKGDKLNGAETLPIILGNIKAMILGKTIIFITSFLLFLPYILGFFSEIYLVFAVAIFLFSIFILKIGDPKKLQKMIKVLMFLVILSFLISVFFSW